MVFEQLHVGISNACNLSCSHCYVRNKNYIKLPYGVLCAFVKDLSVNGLQQIYHTYGEPLLNEEFYKFASFCNKLGLFQTLLTNGTLVTDNIAKNIISTGIWKVSISVDSNNSIQHDNSRGKSGTFTKAIKAIDIFVKNNFHTIVGITYNNNNNDQLFDIVNFCKKCGVDEISILAERNNGIINSKISKQYLKLFYDSVVHNESYIFHDIRLIKYLNKWLNKKIISYNTYLIHKQQNQCFNDGNLSLSPWGKIYNCNFTNHPIYALKKNYNFKEFLKLYCNFKKKSCGYI
jgi:MoaA/NifB/PqqE/SkfB family radical SAM enzyme